MSSVDSEDENDIRYGTPLEPYEEDQVPSKRKYQQKPEQFAVDEHGRRRFHGAFTGGFSAGYGNTVGTPEGWTPSTFKSSRSDKALISSQQPDDFMDDEDRSEFGIAPRFLQTKSEFSGQKRPYQAQFHDGTIPGVPVLQQLIRAVHETTAVKILRKMGWKPGQGIGDRISRVSKKKAKEQHKVYGCEMPAEMRQISPVHESYEQIDSSDSEFEYDTLFAPDDYEPYFIRHKNDKFGLGYIGLSRHSVLGNLVGEYGEGSSRSHLTIKEKGKKVSIRGQAFGVGAFEADDEDIYATEDMSHYDFVIGGTNEKGKVKKNFEKNVNVIEGFVKAKKPIPPVPNYPPPALPRDFVPMPAGSRRSRFEATDAPQRDQALGRHELTAEARGALLGETPLPKTQEIQIQEPDLTTILGKSINFVSTDYEQNKEKSTDFISIRDVTKDKDLKVFKPFVNDPQKQARYERYLENKTVESDNVTDRLSDWERNREKLEFEQSAKLYKPLSGIIGDRFTHASEPDEALNPLCAVTKSSVNYGLATPEQIEAANIGAYGVITRKETTWRPEPIVCKRFNVPELGGDIVLPKENNKPKVSYSIFSYLEASVHDKESFTKEQTKFSGSKSLNMETNIKNKVNNEKEKDITANLNVSNNTIEINTIPNKRMTVAELFLKESEKVLQEKDKGAEVTQTIEKFDKMDLYKSIFLSDSEDETIGINKNNEINEYVDKPKNTERNLSPPRGIFANIDFDELNSWKRHSDTKSDEKQSKSNESIKNNSNNEKNKDCIDSDAVYGPKIPDNLQHRLQSQIVQDNNYKPIFKKKNKLDESSSSSDSWVEAKVKSKKQKKKSKKSKHKKSKHKKKDKYEK